MILNNDKKRQLVCLAIGFSILYAVIEYYLIRDTTFGYQPVVSLLYPYHFAMAAVFSTVTVLLTRYANKTGILAAILSAGIIFSVMLAAEDFMWFVFRASFPASGDANAGKLIMEGEWTTQFFGSVDAYFTHIPNWYFAPLVFAGLSQLASQVKRMTAPAIVVKEISRITFSG